MAIVDENIDSAAETAKERATEAGAAIRETGAAAGSEIGMAVDAVQEIAAEVTPVPATFEQVSSAEDLKARLEWGEPALTIIDVRDRAAFNEERITGAMQYPLDELTQRAEQSLSKDRDIYIYGQDDSQTATAATQLRAAGFERVSALQGGLKAWKAALGPTEGRTA